MLAQAVSAYTNRDTRHTNSTCNSNTSTRYSLVTFTTRASSIVVRAHRLTRRHVARHAHLPMRPSLPPACTSCCRLLHPKGPRPHTLRTFINGFALCGSDHLWLHHRPLCPGLLRVAHWMPPPWMAQRVAWAQRPTRRPRRRRRLRKRLPSPPPRATRPQSWPSDLPN